MRLIDADNMAVVESEAYLYAQSRIKDEMTRSVNAVVHTKIQQLIADTPDADAAEVLRNQWISVEDRFPELIPCSAGTAYSEAVVVLTSGKKAMIAIWDGVDFLCAASYWDAEGEQITHWMPLPEPPEEDKL